jgi:precorrin-3B methylase
MSSGEIAMMSAKDQELYGLAFNVLMKAEKENDTVSVVIARAVIVAIADKNASNIGSYNYTKTNHNIS